MASDLAFAPGETVRFAVTLKLGNTAQDVTSDTVTFWMKSSKADTDAGAAISSSGDVSGGSSGVVQFVLTSDETKALPEGGHYYWEIEWVTVGGDEYLPLDGEITLDTRTSDVPS